MLLVLICYMNDGIILTLAYPETIVSHAEEWYSKFLPFVFIGNKTHVRAGHAALVLIDKTTGVLEYHDFGRYITPAPHGRVRGRDTDFELNFPISAEINNDTIQNLDEILKFLAMHAELTHGDGHLHASVCKDINYKKARMHITELQNKGFIRYAAFAKEASNCARFVADTLIASVTNTSIKKRLIRSKIFTPSTVGNVVIADTENHIYTISEAGIITTFNSTVSKENRRCFLDVLKGYRPSVFGKLIPKSNTVKKEHAQWLGGIAAGAWFELYMTEDDTKYRYRRISPHGNVDCDGVYQITSEGFEYNAKYTFEHYSNCKFFYVKQNGFLYRFEYLRNF